MIKAKQRLREEGKTGEAILRRIERLEKGNAINTWYHPLYYYFIGSSAKLNEIYDAIVNLSTTTSVQSQIDNSSSSLYNALNSRRLFSCSIWKTRTLDYIVNESKNTQEIKRVNSQAV